MKKIEMTIASTFTDGQGERLPVEALHQMAEVTKSAYIPITIEHDPRRPPIGRIEDAFVRLREDGEHELVASGVLFSENDIWDNMPSDKEMVIEGDPDGRLSLKYDFNNRNPEDLRIFKEIENQTGISSSYVAKKALQPLSVIALVAGTFALGEISKGFLSKLSIDTYDALKKGLKHLLSKRNEGEKEKLLSLELSVVKGGERFILEIIVTNPTEQDIDDLLEGQLSKIDSLVERHFVNGHGLRKLVYEVRDGELQIQFVVRKDCYPLAVLDGKPPV